MVFRVKLQQEICFNIEAETEHVVWDWLLCTTPAEAANLIGRSCDYSEEIIAEMPEDIKPDYVLG